VCAAAASFAVGAPSPAVCAAAAAASFAVGAPSRAWCAPAAAASLAVGAPSRAMCAPAASGPIVGAASGAAGDAAVDGCDAEVAGLAPGWLGGWGAVPPFVCCAKFG